MNILFVHGFGGSKYECTPIGDYITSHIDAKCHYFEYLSFNRGQVPIAAIAEKLQQFCITKDLDPDMIIGISQGGIIAAHYLEVLHAQKQTTCLTICSPFHGSFLGYLMDRPGTRELRPGSRYLVNLRALCGRGQNIYYGIWNPCDLMVLPGSSARTRFMSRTRMVIAPLHQLTFWRKRTKEFALSIAAQIQRC